MSKPRPRDEFVLIAPPINTVVAHELSRLSYKPFLTERVSTIPSEGANINQGDTLYDCEKDRSGMIGEFFRDKFNIRSSKTSIHLPIGAPVHGFYKSMSTPFFGLRDSTISEECVTQSLAQMRAGRGEHAFAAITYQSQKLTAGDVYRDFFDKLREERQKITKWLEVDKNSSYVTQRFWDRITAEEERLDQIVCPLVLYDGQGLG